MSELRGKRCRNDRLRMRTTNNGKREGSPQDARYRHQYQTKILLTFSFGKLSECRLRRFTRPQQDVSIFSDVSLSIIVEYNLRDYRRKE